MRKPCGGGGLANFSVNPLGSFVLFPPARAAALRAAGCL